MTVQELITILETMDPDAQVLMTISREWPFEYSVQGVAVRSDFVEYDDDDDDISERPDDAYGKPQPHPDDVLLVEGEQLRYGVKAAWDVARRR